MRPTLCAAGAKLFRAPAAPLAEPVADRSNALLDIEPAGPDSAIKSFAERIYVTVEVYPRCTQTRAERKVGSDFELSAKGGRLHLHKRVNGSK